MLSVTAALAALALAVSPVAADDQDGTGFFDIASPTSVTMRYERVLEGHGQDPRCVDSTLDDYGATELVEQIGGGAEAHMVVRGDDCVIVMTVPDLDPTSAWTADVVQVEGDTLVAYNAMGATRMVVSAWTDLEPITPGATTDSGALVWDPTPDQVSVRLPAGALAGSGSGTREDYTLDDGYVLDDTLDEEPGALEVLVALALLGVPVLVVLVGGGLIVFLLVRSSRRGPVSPYPYQVPTYQAGQHVYAQPPGAAPYPPVPPAPPAPGAYSQPGPVQPPTWPGQA